MNWAMNEHAATRENLRVLAERGVEVLPTEEGELACGEEGSGRMASPDAIRARRAPRARGVGLRAARRQEGRRHLRRHARAHRRGPLHRQPLERQDGPRRRRRGVPARRPGDARDHAAGGRRLLRRRAASRAPPRWPRRSASRCATPTCSSWPRPSPTSGPKDEEGGKIERGERESLTLELVRTVDVLASTARPGLYRVGFAAEAGPRLDRARAKKAAKGVDLLVFNDILAEGVGIGSDENEITILTPDGEVHVPRTTKTACAARHRRPDRGGAARDDARPRSRCSPRCEAHVAEREPAPPHARHRGDHARAGRAPRRGPRRLGARRPGPRPGLRGDRGRLRPSRGRRRRDSPRPGAARRGRPRRGRAQSGHRRRRHRAHRRRASSPPTSSAA